MNINIKLELYIFLFIYISLRRSSTSTPIGIAPHSIRSIRVTPQWQLCPTLSLLHPSFALETYLPHSHHRRSASRHPVGQAAMQLPPRWQHPHNQRGAVTFMSSTIRPKMATTRSAWAQCMARICHTYSVHRLWMASVIFRRTTPSRRRRCRRL